MVSAPVSTIVSVSIDCDLTIDLDGDARLPVVMFANEGLGASFVLNRSRWADMGRPEVVHISVPVKVEHLDTFTG